MSVSRDIPLQMTVLPGGGSWVRARYTRGHPQVHQRLLRPGLVPRTVYDRLVTVLQLFKRYRLKGLVERSDWPSYAEAIGPNDEPEEIATMLRHADRDEASSPPLFNARIDRQVC
jgi:hypothetical protein